MANSKKNRLASLFFEYKEHRQYQAGEACDMVPAEGFVFHYQLHDNRKDRKRYDLLNNFEFPNREWSAILHTAQAVSRYHKAVLEKCHQPADENHGYQADALEFALEHHLTVPRQGHKQVRADQKTYGR